MVRRAVELGVTLIDTAFPYNGGRNEELLVEARAVVDVVSVQNRYNVLDREHEPVVAGATGDRPEIATVAAELGATPTQVAIAWLLDRSPVMLPIPGTADVGHLEENLAAGRIELTADHRAALENVASPPA